MATPKTNSTNQHLLDSLPKPPSIPGLSVDSLFEPIILPNLIQEDAALTNHFKELNKPKNIAEKKIFIKKLKNQMSKFIETEIKVMSYEFLYMSVNVPILTTLLASYSAIYASGISVNAADAASAASILPTGSALPPVALRYAKFNLEMAERKSKLEFMSSNLENSAAKFIEAADKIYLR